VHCFGVANENMEEICLCAIRKIVDLPCHQHVMVLAPLVEHWANQSRFVVHIGCWINVDKLVEGGQCDWRGVILGEQQGLEW